MRHAVWMSLLRALCCVFAAGVSITDPLEPPVFELGGPAIPAGYLLKCPRRWRLLSGDWISASAGGNPVDRVDTVTLGRTAPDRPIEAHEC
jgi:hypothetical protein